MLKSYKTVVLILLIFLIAIKKISCLNFPKISFSNSNNAINLKVKILELAKKTNRGLTETPNDKETMNKLFESLEKLNRNKKTLSNPSLNAIWSLEYTTSDSILGRGGPERFGPILQTINTNDLKAENAEVINYFGFLKIQRKVTADLTPISESEVAVQFKKFTIGPITFNAPESFKGRLDVTYLDDNLRLSRGDKGNIFVLTKYSDLQ